MHHDDTKRRSRWILRVVEWNEPKARYPNIWHAGMPRHLLLLNRVAGRLRLGDLIAVYYPQSQAHAERSERFLGLSRVAGLRKGDAAGYAWVDLETAHKLNRPLPVSPAPHRVFLCCDPGWPDPEVALFRSVLDAALAEGFEPLPDERDDALTPPLPKAKKVAPAPAPSKVAPESESKPESEPEPEREPEPEPETVSTPEATSDAPGETETPAATSQEPEAEAPTVAPDTAPTSAPASAEPTPAPERMFAGADYSGDMRDAKDRTWLAIVGLEGERLRVLRLHPTGRSGLQGSLRDPDTSLMSAEAIGLGFPFAMPQPFAERLLEGPFPDEGWWALVKRLERTSRPEFLAAVHDFREAHGEIKRLTDETARSLSPLHRGKRDLSPMAYHGIRMIAEDRSRYAVRPFESASARLLLEVSPQASARRLLDAPARKSRSALLERLGKLDYLPVELPAAHLRACRDRTAALDAVLAARAAAIAVLTGEAEKSPDELAPGDGERVRREGWIYGLGEPQAEQARESA